ARELPIVPPLLLGHFCELLQAAVPLAAHREVEQSHWFRLINFRPSADQGSRPTDHAFGRASLRTFRRTHRSLPASPAAGTWTRAGRAPHRRMRPATPPTVSSPSPDLEAGE